MSQLTLITAALLVWQVLLLIPMAPGNFIDTRDFSSLPRWQYNWFNVFLISLSAASIVVAGFAVAGSFWVFGLAVIIGVLYLLVFFADLFKIFPVVDDPLPAQLLVLEAISLASAGVLVVIALRGLLF